MKSQLIKTWSVYTESGNIIIKLNDQQYNLGTSGHSFVFDLVKTLDDLEKDAVKELKEHLRVMLKKKCARCLRVLPSIIIESDGICGECKDDEIELLTGCRFGLETCNHSDCNGKSFN